MTATTTAGSAGWSDERLARAALGFACEAGSAGLATEVARSGAPAVWEALRDSTKDTAWARRARHVDVGELVATAQRHHVRFVIPGDAEWPEQLDVLDRVQVAGLGGMPVGLWLRGPGHLDGWARQSVAVVGSRACTPYGDRVASDLAMDLAEPGVRAWTIISGGAYGIDGSAHRGAMAAGGRTVAVLAGGLDEPYPRGNAQLFERLAAEQLLVSELPCGMHPTRVGFLARNRLIAALSLGTVVVEAAARSGANNTASWAAECGRELMAVPGSVHSAQSITPHRLLRDHRAALVTCADEVRSVVGSLVDAPTLPVGGSRRLLDGLDPVLMAVREALPGRGAMASGEVARRCGLAMPRALASLGQLEQLGLARHDETGLWRLARPPGIGDEELPCGSMRGRG